MTSATVQPITLQNAARVLSEVIEVRKQIAAERLADDVPMQDPDDRADVPWVTAQEARRGDGWLDDVMRHYEEGAA